MAEITASMVKELRERTGLGMMECKKALEEAGGDMKKAEDLLRIKSGAKASKVAGRVAAEGAVAASVSADGKTGALVEVNSETDFVAKDANFTAFAASVAQVAVAQQAEGTVALAQQKLPSGGTVEAARIALGPYLAPGRMVVPKSKGSPMMATSGLTLSSSALLLTHGSFKNVGMPTKIGSSFPLYESP